MSKEEKSVSSMPAIAVFIVVIVAIIALYLGGLFVTNKSTDVVEAAEPDEEVEVVEETTASALPAEYVLIVNAGEKEIEFEMEVKKIIRNSDNSIIIETSLFNELILDDGVCTIVRVNGLVEQFADYTLILKKNYSETKMVIVGQD